MKKWLGMLLSLVLLLGAYDNVLANEIVREVSINDFLLNTGMAQEEIDKMDPDFKQYIVESLRENTTGNIEYIDAADGDTVQSRSTQELDGARRSVTLNNSGGFTYGAYIWNARETIDFVR